MCTKAKVSRKQIHTYCSRRTQAATFLVNLENRELGVQRHVMSDVNRLADYTDVWIQTHSQFWILSDGDHLSFVDEILVYADAAQKMFYRNVMKDNSVIID